MQGSLFSISLGVSLIIHFISHRFYYVNVIYNFNFGFNFSDDSLTSLNSLQMFVDLRYF